MRDNLTELQKVVAAARRALRRPWWDRPLRVLATLQHLAAWTGILIILLVLTSVLLRREPTPKMSAPATAPAGAGPRTPVPSPAAADAAPAEDARPAPPQPPHRQTQRIDKTVTVGQWRYTVHDVERTRSLGRQDGQTVSPKPGLEFVIIRLTAWNTGRMAAVLPPARLLDPSGQTFEPQADGRDEPAVATDAIGPEAPHSLTLRFEVPPGASYKLVLSGGWLSDKTATVDLGPQDEAREQSIGVERP